MVVVVEAGSAGAPASQRATSSGVGGGGVVVVAAGNAGAPANQRASPGDVGGGCVVAVASSAGSPAS